MNHYDIVFMGNFAMARIVPFQEPSYFEGCGPVTFSSIAASCLAKRIATVTKITESDEPLLEPLKAAGSDIYALTGETTQFRIVFLNQNVEDRQFYIIKGGGCFCIDDISSIESYLIHLASLANSREFPRD